MHKNNNIFYEKSVSLNQFEQNGKLSNQKYLDRQQQFESNARSYPRRIPIAIKEAQEAF